jgi:hypothetical protein
MNKDLDLERFTEDIAVIQEAHREYIGRHKKEDWAYNIQTIMEKVDSFAKTPAAPRRFIREDWPEEKRAIYQEIAMVYIARAGYTKVTVSALDLVRAGWEK